MSMLNGIILFGIMSFLIFFLFIFKSFLNFHHTKRIINDFENYTAVLQFHMEKAYDLIHKDRILIYSLEATKVPEEQINVISRDFITLLCKLLGKRLLKEFIFLYGNYETFAFMAAEYFSTRYEEDEIRKATISEMMESKVEE